MHKIELNNGKTLQFASCIEEMSPADFVHMLKLLEQNRREQITVEEFKTLLLMRLLRIKKSVKYYRLSELEKEQVHDNLNRIVELVESFYVEDVDEGGQVKALRLEFIKNMVPRIGKLFGPKDALQDVTFFEYKEAFNYFIEYSESGEITALDSMIAVLYRPQKSFLWLRRLLGFYDGNDRFPYTPKSNPDQFNRRLKAITKAPDHLKLGVYLFFNSCNTFLRSGRPVIDGHEIDLSILYKGMDENVKPSIGLTGLLYSLSEGKVFGSLLETSNTNIYDIFARLYQLKVEFDNSKPKK